jgi:hypothetical protein
MIVVINMNENQTWYLDIGKHTYIGVCLGFVWFVWRINNILVEYVDDYTVWHLCSVTFTVISDTQALGLSFHPQTTVTLNSINAEDLAETHV